MTDLEQILTAVFGAIGGAGTLWGASLIKRGKVGAPSSHNGNTNRILETLQEHTRVLREIHGVLIEVRGQLNRASDNNAHLFRMLEALHRRLDDWLGKR
jgi:hypothetical protein